MPRHTERRYNCPLRRVEISRVREQALSSDVSLQNIHDSKIDLRLFYNHPYFDTRESIITILVFFKH